MAIQVSGAAAVMSSLSATKINIQKLGDSKAIGVDQDNGELKNAAIAKITAPAPSGPVAAAADTDKDRGALSGMGAVGGAAGAGASGSGKGASSGGMQALLRNGAQDSSANTSAATAKMDDSRSGVYASNGGGGRGAKGSGSSWSFGSELGGGASDGKTSQVNFKGAGDEVSPLGSEDPEDYFARLSMQDSLFKIVERRYVSKQESWTKADQSLAVSRAKQH